MTVNEIITLISSFIALIGAVTGILIARSTRHKNEGDAALAISQAAENIVTLREKDIETKQKTIDALADKVDNLERYVMYLHDWIGEHVDGPAEPKPFQQFVKDRQKGPK